MTAHNDYEALEVTVCGDSLVHVVARPAGAPVSTAPRLWMLDKSQSCPGAAFQFSQANGVTTLTTVRLTVSLSAQKGTLSFDTLGGEMLVREYPNLPRTYLPSGMPALYHIEDRFLKYAKDGAPSGLGSGK